jgi:hypothetical protein
MGEYVGEVRGGKSVRVKQHREIKAENRKVSGERCRK